MVRQQTSEASLWAGMLTVRASSWPLVYRSPWNIVAYPHAVIALSSRSSGVMSLRQERCADVTKCLKKYARALVSGSGEGRPELEVEESDRVRSSVRLGPAVCVALVASPSTFHPVGKVIRHTRDTTRDVSSRNISSVTFRNPPHAFPARTHRPHAGTFWSQLFFETLQFSQPALGLPEYTIAFAVLRACPTASLVKIRGNGGWPDAWVATLSAVAACLGEHMDDGWRGHVLLYERSCRQIALRGDAELASTDPASLFATACFSLRDRPSALNPHSLHAVTVPESLTVKNATLAQTSVPS